MSESALPSMRVDGQVALVTGAGRGIGRGCALALAEAGAEAVELEALSFEPHVLRTCRRGYKSGRIITMATALAEMGRCHWVTRL